ncbi:MAG: MarR family transcriptional regulator [Corynebacterium sp.]|nr:MarR family transcriptional regulator [Corynebacterium sp.]
MPDSPSSAADELADKLTLVSRLIRRASRDLPLPPHQVRALRIIAREPIRPARLAEHLHITPRAVTDVVDTLTEGGYITATADPTDRRAKILSTTPAGTDLLAIAQQLREAEAKKLFSHLSEDEQRTLLDLLTRILTPHRV